MVEKSFAVKSKGAKRVKHPHQKEEKEQLNQFPLHETKQNKFFLCKTFTFFKTKVITQYLRISFFFET